MKICDHLASPPCWNWQITYCCNRTLGALNVGEHSEWNHRCVVTWQFQLVESLWSTGVLNYSKKWSVRPSFLQFPIIFLAICTYRFLVGTIYCSFGLYHENASIYFTVMVIWSVQGTKALPTWPRHRRSWARANAWRSLRLLWSRGSGSCLLWAAARAPGRRWPSLSSK